MNRMWRRAPGLAVDEFDLKNLKFGATVRLVQEWVFAVFGWHVCTLRTSYVVHRLGDESGTILLERILPPWIAWEYYHADRAVALQPAVLKVGEPWEKGGAPLSRIEFLRMTATSVPAGVRQLLYAVAS